MSDDRIAVAQAQLEQRRRNVAAERARRPPEPAKAADVLPDVKELKGYSGIVRALSSKDGKTRKRARFALADDTRRNLHRYKRTAIPSYPHRLPPESVLMTILKKKRIAADRPTVLLFVKWRVAVERAEHVNAGTLRALFEAVESLRALDLPDYAAEILEHLELEYEVEAVPARDDWDFERLSRDYATLSTNLRRGSYEKRRVPQSHPEDDDSALRGDVEIPAPGSSPDPDDAFEVPEFP
jgi:hypothetical protein